jgi:type I restriction enzyme R subunit
MDKKALSEEDIKLQYITPAITETAGWDKKLIRMEYYYTAGRVVFAGKQHTHAEGKKVDYLLFADKANNYPIAVVEAKDNNKSVGHGMQQAIGYARDLDVRFAYSSNGDAFLEHDLKTGKETELPLDKFPTLADLKARIQREKHYTQEERKIIQEPYFFDTIKKMRPRYYQTIAINRTIEAIARGQQRILLVMATGTGKTFTAFQILWRLFQSGTKKKILYIADRNILIDQTMTQDFKPFQKIMTKIGSEKDSEGKTIVDSAYSIYMSLYQQLVSNDPEVPDPFTQVSPDFFDLVVIDECHRGSVRDDSDWKKILTYFSSATQIGMTATPKSQEGADNLDYFGEPVYTYSLRQGILD